MLGEQAKYRNDYMVTEVCIDTGTNMEDIDGYLVHKATGRAWRFKGLVDMVNHLEELFDTENFPQATHKMREMKSEKENAGKIEVSLEDIAMDASELKDKAPTFVIKVQYRQNASWQGMIQWLKGEKETQFKSALELIKLMDSVIARDDDGAGWE
ncbi:hypothetical protein LJC56_08030 [Christensenellaceae bacterium OttesenSCG-928-K19]|nr:hypothetical protein [Christensenellaceae bacterium OttesenSCG-928-K19]